MQLLNNTNIDFISKTKITFFISLVIILLGISSLIIKKGPKLSIDFVGGTVIQVATSKEINIKLIKYKNRLNIEQFRTVEDNITSESRCEDCMGNDCSEVEDWIGDGTCDNGTTCTACATNYKKKVNVTAPNHKCFDSSNEPQKYFFSTKETLQRPRQRICGPMFRRH